MTNADDRDLHRLYHRRLALGICVHCGLRGHAPDDPWLCDACQGRAQQIHTALVASAPQYRGEVADVTA